MTLRVDRLVIGRDAFRSSPIGFTAAPGAFVALIGPNGGGKTTLLKTLAGLLPALGGGFAFETRAPVAYLPPPGALSAGLSAQHLVALARAPARGWSPVLAEGDYRAATAALAQFGIADLAARAFDTLSSGQQQLALFARLTVQDARLCLLDEPTALLDPPHAAEVEAAIGLLTGEGRVVIASTHHLALAGRADQVIALGAEKIRVGTPADMLTAEALSALYGARIALCPCCGQPISDAISA